MKILLISPACGKWQMIAKRKTFNGRTFRFSMLSLLTVAALSPEDAQVSIIDEQIDNIPWDEHFDLVGITAMTATAPRAYEIAARFRQRAVPVVLGGFHPSLNTDEAVQHADAVVVGPAFGAWQQLMEDLKENKLKRIYYGNHEGKVPKTLPRGLISADNYATVNAAYATMGCKNRCRFCSISAFYKARHYVRNIDDVADEIAGFKDRFFMFVDDNLTQDKDYAGKLLRKITPLGKKWITQASIEIADEPELLELMRKAGCVGLFIGLESFSDKALGSQDKQIKASEGYRQAVKTIHSYGIFVESGVIFGFDDDDISTFGTTLKALERIGIDAIQVSILTPVPGTALFDEMKDRVTDRNWEHYDYRHVVFTPRRMDADELQAGADWVIRRYYSPWHIAKRLLRWIRMPSGFFNLIYPLGLNIAYYGRVRAFGIRGHNPLENDRVWQGEAAVNCRLS